MTSRSDEQPLQALQPEIEHILDMLLNDQDTRRFLDELADRNQVERVEVYRATNLIRRFRRQRRTA